MERALLLSGKYREARKILSGISSEFGEEAQPGKARILEAAALLELAKKVSGVERDELLQRAKSNFLSGINKQRDWWIDVVRGRKVNRYEPFAKITTIFQPNLDEWLME